LKKAGGALAASRLWLVFKAFLMDSPEWHSAASDPRDFVGVDLGQSRARPRFAMVRELASEVGD
jgi:hypothetical protein